MKNYKLKFIFVRSVMFTKWTHVSEACVQHFFPDAIILNIDGRPRNSEFNSTKLFIQKIIGSLPLKLGYASVTSSFDPLKAIEIGLGSNCDYIIHLDEDCFITDGSQIYEIIDEMEKDPDIVLFGPSDGLIPYYRTGYNPIACNMFFNVIKVKPLRRLIEHVPNWRNFTEHDLSNPQKAAALRRVRKTYSNFTGEKYGNFIEPYYSFYWLILKCSMKINYLPAYLANDQTRATTIRLDGHTKDLCSHLWYTREWGKTSSVDGMDNLKRYEAMDRLLCKQHIL